MNKFLSILAAGLIAGGLGVSAFAADAAKPAGVSTEKAIAQKAETKKDTGLKASMKKLFSSDSKKTDAKLK
jgi:hypothetical protein